MKTTKTLILVGIAALLLPGTLTAPNAKDQDCRGDAVSNNFVINPMRICWRTTEWTPSLAAAHCDTMATTGEVPAPGVVVASAPARSPAVAAVPPAPAPQCFGVSTEALSTDDAFLLNTKH
jgi:hypothetical protein